MLNTLYNHLLSLPETREFFETQDNPAPQTVPHLLADAHHRRPPRRELLGYLMRVGKVHRDYGVPSYQIVHLIGWVQGTISSALLATDRPEKEAEANAWPKLFTAQLDPMLTPYQEPKG